MVSFVPVAIFVLNVVQPEVKLRFDFKKLLYLMGFLFCFVFFVFCFALIKVFDVYNNICSIVCHEFISAA